MSEQQRTRLVKDRGEIKDFTRQLVLILKQDKRKKKRYRHIAKTYQKFVDKITASSSAAAASGADQSVQ